MSSEVALLLEHTRGEHRIEPKKGCRACEAVQAAEGPQAGAQGRKKARKRPPAGKKGQCEHCGAPTGGRFAVGHDAKLKSELAAAANGGDASAWAELLIREWTHVVKTWPDRQVQTVGEKVAREATPQWLEDRNAMRRGRWQG